MAVKEKYKVVEGVHYEPNSDWDGKNSHAPDRHIKYSKNDVVESERDLSQVYVGKFVKVQNEAPTFISQERKAIVDKLIHDGLWAEEDRAFLHTLHEDGFNRIQRQAAAKREQVVTTDPTPPKPHPLGTEVTQNFQRAIEGGFKVFRNAAGKHQVTEHNIDTKPLNTKALAEKEVEAFIENYLKEKK